MATPRVAKLNVNSKIIDGDIESDGQKVKKITRKKRKSPPIQK
jgi:hypothetical protein